MPPPDEEQEAKDYWARSQFDYYHTDGPQRPLMVRAIRVTRGSLVLLEPFNGRNERAAEVRTRFNYYWDYPRIARDLGMRVLTDLRYPLGDLPMQRAYRLYVLGSGPAVRGLPRGFVLAQRIGGIWLDVARRPRAARSRG